LVEPLPARATEAAADATIANEANAASGLIKWFIGTSWMSIDTRE
jgi:hypothetical protein